MAMMSVFLPLWLTGCAGSNDIVPVLPAAPDTLVLCAGADVSPLPGEPGTGLTRVQAAEALADNRAAALMKDRCARSWAAFYDDLLEKWQGRTGTTVP